MTDNTGPSAAGARPTPGFTFADKRKVNPEASASAPVTDEAPGSGAGGDTPTVPDPAVDGSEQAQPMDEQPSEFEALASERLADLQRLQAEYANYRKRVERDRDVARDSAIAAVVDSLLPVLDDIQLARQHGDLESGPFASIAEKLENSLAKFGVARFGEPGVPFDPSVHDALMHVEEELAEGTEVTTVVGILQPGYTLGDRVLRPARVSVADPR